MFLPGCDAILDSLFGSRALGIRHQSRSPISMDATKQPNTENQSMRNGSGMRILHGPIFLLPQRRKTKENRALLTGYRLADRD